MIPFFIFTIPLLSGGLLINIADYSHFCRPMAQPKPTVPTVPSRKSVPLSVTATTGGAITSVPSLSSSYVYSTYPHDQKRKKVILNYKRQKYRVENKSPITGVKWVVTFSMREQEKGVNSFQLSGIFV